MCVVFFFQQFFFKARFTPRFPVKTGCTLTFSSVSPRFPIFVSTCFRYEFVETSSQNSFELMSAFFVFPSVVSLNSQGLGRLYNSVDSLRKIFVLKSTSVNVEFQCICSRNGGSFQDQNCVPFFYSCIDLWGATHPSDSAPR